ncbi:MAG: ABC transporter substrate-binding protein [Clostridiales bacterium]|jgi:putative aldouronate transport system substrate-binding protein|nr:ABC transporter substrate-binding protein [Clostridiales bacterium]
MKKKMAILLAFMMAAASVLVPVTVSAANEDVPTIIWWNVGDPPTGGEETLERWHNAVNAYLEASIGVRVDYRNIPWGDWPQRQNTIINSGEYYDILFTDLSIYNNYVSMGAFADLTDLLNETPGLKYYIPDNIWKGVTNKDGIFAVPTVKDTARADYFVLDAKYTDKYGYDPADLTSLASLDPYFRAVKEGEGADFYPYQMTQATVFGAAFVNYDGLGASLPPIGVSMNDDSKKVVTALEQPDVMETLRQLHTWYKDGIINPDANVATEQNLQRPFFVGIGWPGAVSIWQASEGVEKYTATLAYGPTYTTDSIQGSLNSISVNSNHKEAALKLLEFVNLDHKARDMFAYGVEGEDFEYVEPSVVRALNDTFSNFSLYSQATFFTMSTREGGQKDQWDEVRAQNDAATASPLLGFMMDLEPVRNEMTACIAIWERYRRDLLTGAVDPDEVVPQIIKEMNAVGLEKIIAEAQSQVDAF